MIRMTRLFHIICFAVLASACGCVNCYTRWPTTDMKITMVYQCSREAAELSVLVAFPQAMSDGPSRGFMWENIFTIPLGFLCLCDAAVEACVDTVCLPIDWPLAASRREAQEGKMRSETQEGFKADVAVRRGDRHSVSPVGPVQKN